ncbi:hypothetical protein RRG08_051816, partial [Elysia crispata]
IFTGDENWVHSWGPELKSYSAVGLKSDELRPAEDRCK